jgi:hypothetical protein
MPDGNGSEGYKVAYTGADLIAMARMVMKREREHGDAVKTRPAGARTRYGTRVTTEINGGKGKPAPAGWAQ